MTDVANSPAASIVMTTSVAGASTSPRGLPPSPSTARPSLSPTSPQQQKRWQSAAGTTSSSSGKAKQGANTDTSPASVPPSSATAHVLTLGQLDVDRRLDFLSTNRVVSVLEKAVERLQLLSLLDAVDAAAQQQQRGGEAGHDGGSDDDDDAVDVAGTGGGGGAGRQKLKGSATGGESLSKAQRILARFAVDVNASTAAATTSTALTRSNAIIQEALVASAVTSRPAATFVSLEGHGTNTTGEGDAAVDPASTRRTAAQVTAALAEASRVSRRGRLTVSEMLAEQQRLETRYGELLRAAQRLNLTQAARDMEGGVEQVPQSGGAMTTTDRELQACFTHVKDSERAAVQHELKAVSQRLREHARYLCTQLKDSPNDGDNWRKIANERKELIALLKATMTELTTGYAESRRTQYQGTGTLEGSFRNGGAGGLRRIDSKSSLLSAANNNSTTPNSHGNGANGESSRRGSQQSDGFPGSRCPSATSSQVNPGGPLNKRFGSTAQMRRAMRPTANHPRVPLVSSYAKFARKILQEDAAQRWADDLVSKERELNQNVKQLQSDLLLERNRREKEVAERQQRLHALRVQLRELKRELKQRSDEAKERAEAAGEGLQRKAHEEECELNDQCDKLHRQLTVEQRTHELFTRHLRERAAEMDTLAAEWQLKNPAEVKKTELKKMDAEQTRQQCAERLEGCEHELLVQEERQKERERAAAEASAAAAAAEARREAVYASASKLQAAVRAMLTREAIAKLKKKNGKQKKKRTSSAAGTTTGK